MKVFVNDNIFVINCADDAEIAKISNLLKSANITVPVKEVVKSSITIDDFVITEGDYVLCKTGIEDYKYSSIELKRRKIGICKIERIKLFKDKHKITISYTKYVKSGMAIVPDTFRMVLHAKANTLTKLCRFKELDVVEVGDDYKGYENLLYSVKRQSEDGTIVTVESYKINGDIKVIDVYADEVRVAFMTEISYGDLFLTGTVLHYTDGLIDNSSIDEINNLHFNTVAINTLVRLIQDCHVLSENDIAMVEYTSRVKVMDGNDNMKVIKEYDIINRRSVKVSKLMKL